MPLTDRDVAQQSDPCRVAAPSKDIHEHKPQRQPERCGRCKCLLTLRTLAWSICHACWTGSPPNKEVRQRIRMSDRPTSIAHAALWVPILAAHVSGGSDWRSSKSIRLSSCALLASQRTICRVRTIAFSSLRMNVSGGWPKKTSEPSLNLTKGGA